MAAITTRAAKGAALSHAEMDANLENLNNAKLEADSYSANNTLLIRDKDGNLIAQTIAEGSILGRLVGGNIKGMTPAELKTLLALALADVAGLVDALNAKAASAHNHAIADVTDLQTTLDGLDTDLTAAENAITDLEADVADLQGALNGLTVFATGTDTLVAGTKAVSVLDMLATDKVVVGVLVPGGTQGALFTTGSEVGGFTCKSTDGADTSTFFYIVYR